MTTSQSWIVYEGNIPVDMMIECLNDKKVELTFGLTRRDYFVFHIITFQPPSSTTYLVAARAQKRCTDTSQEINLGLWKLITQIQWLDWLNMRFLKKMAPPENVSSGLPSLVSLW